MVVSEGELSVFTGHALKEKIVFSRTLGPVVESGGMLPRKILIFQGPRNAILGVLAELLHYYRYCLTIPIFK